MIHDDAARQNALISGEVDYIDTADLNTVHLLERAPGINILSVTGTQHYGLPMDTRAEPFDDNNVRMALKYAIDRQQLVDTILNGYGEIGNDHPIGSGQQFYNADLEQHTYDPDRARFHLREAGMESLDVEINLADAAFAGALDAGVLFAESAAAAGINLTVVREPTTVTGPTSGCRSPSPAPTGAVVRPRTSCSPLPIPRVLPWNETYWYHDRFNELLVQARSELDEDLRREMYFEMQDICSNEGGALIPMFASYVGAYADTLAHSEGIAANWRNDGSADRGTLVVRLLI